MLDLVGSGILGSLVGGLFRLAPELINFLDRKNERSHELLMFKEQIDLEKTKGEFKVEEKYVDYSVEQMKAIGEAYKEQSLTASSSYKWVAALSALVRPLVTYVLFGMYICFKATMMVYAVNSGVPWDTVMLNSWSADDFGMLNMILTFWFLGRTIDKYRK